MSVLEEITSSYKNIFFHISLGSYLTPHTHNGYWEFMYIERGEITHIYNNQEKEIKERSLVLLRPHDCHSIKGNQDATRVMVGVRCEYLKQYLDALEPGTYDKLLFSPDIPSVTLQEEKVSEISKIENTLLLANKDNNYKILQCLFFTLIGEILFSEVKAPQNIYHYSKPVNTLLQLISDSNNLSLSMPDLIKKTVYSYSHTNRLFLNEVGITLSDYLRGKRIDHAKSLLINTDRPLKEIASSVGYNNYSNFSIFFQSKTGKTPAEYRQSHNKPFSQLL